VAAVPLDDAVQLVFDQLPLLELAAASLHGEQAVANLMKIKQMASALADRPQLTLSGFIDIMVTRLDEHPDEAESPLVEDSSDAVQILTIHKAKGLEFPIVVLPGLHQGSGRDPGAPTIVHDWSSGTYGLSIGAHSTLGYLRVQEKQLEREKAERRRVLYVGMTRAKELLVLSGGLTSRSVGETVLEWLQEIAEGEIGNPLTQTVKIGSSQVVHRIVHAPERRWPKRVAVANEERPVVDPSALARLWENRTARWTTVQARDWHVTPSSSVQKSFPAGGPASGVDGQETSLLVGIAAHRILESWDFARPPADLLKQIPHALDHLLSPEQHDVRSQATDSLTDIFTTFGASEWYARLRSAAILGREVPFLIPWDDRQVMEGVIDVIYRLDGKIWIADYKTDWISASEASARAEVYAHQAAIYREAASRCLGLSTISFQFLFLRPGVCVDL
jgi:ATP-dependent helicase/nuclease subunit A